MSPQLLSKFFGGRITVIPHAPNADTHSTPPEGRTIEDRLKGYGMSGFRPAGLPDAWSEVDEPWIVEHNCYAPASCVHAQEVMG